jgi:hypothetical protein
MPNKVNKSVGIQFTGDVKDFKAATTELKRLMDQQTNQIKARNAEIQSSYNKIHSTLKGIAVGLASAFSLGAIVAFSKESMKLAAEAEGVINAYKRLGQVGVSVLEEMKQATRGTIDESDLMALAIKAQNFKIPLENLGTLLKFATNRAIQTGESISELNNKIVEGLGRRAPKSLVALGVAAKDAKDAFGKPGFLGVMELVNAEIGKMGTVTDTAVVRQEAFAASIHNLKEAWGGFLNNSELVKKSIMGITNLLQDLANRGLLKKLFESKAETKARAEESAKWDVDASGIPMSMLTGPAAEVVGIKSKPSGSKGVSRSSEMPIGSVSLPAIGSLAGTTTPDWWQGWIDQIQGKNNNLVGGDFYQEQADKIAEVNDLLKEQSPIVQTLTSTFENMFANIDSGFGSMIESLMQSLKKMITFLAAKAAVFGLLTLITGGTGTLFSSLGGFTKFVFGGKFASGTNFAPGGLSLVGERGPEVVNLPRGSQVIPYKNQAMKIEVVGRITGKDLALIMRRHGG